ncbi:MarR family transcriptional regulator [Bacteroides helcogenes]|uniref:Regulatory protein MarR n=1 Tax=Bacteroides helcogenes (strain ATCC 35417 / DSM 20613 / JCM 6297 / CCUG 15421 / P 36-108) TaxID=693979 RepID=E6SQ53_BACT6|nr:MarR family transcriptional regulator [Bacteroides helcogenes]ADV43912.1 regulatory protein MarR [Bacteroides helcogenes P 36-108]MDY5237538.1 MarR family transcriptional regulator [Bacteroides helcogenes]
METLCKIRDVYRAIAEFEAQFMQMYDLSLNEGMLLCTLLNRPRLTSSEIAEALGLSASNTSKVIRSVEDKKLITRLIGKEDKRQMHFTLTVGGKNRIADIKNATFEMPELLQQVIGLVE